MLLGCYFFPIFKESFGDRNILFVKLFYVVWYVLLGCYFFPFFTKSFGDSNFFFVKLFYVVLDLLHLVVLFTFLNISFVISMDFLRYSACYMHCFSNEDIKVVGGKK